MYDLETIAAALTNSADCLETNLNKHGSGWTPHRRECTTRQLSAERRCAEQLRQPGVTAEQALAALTTVAGTLA